ncbi:MAG: DUF4062 domain-containing protein [Pseudonocardiaceae bacterium]
MHRQQALDACLRQDFFPVMMEHLPPSPDDAVRRSLDLVDQADVYVLVLGLRYGEIPDGHEKSYTHLELCATFPNQSSLMSSSAYPTFLRRSRRSSTGTGAPGGSRSLALPATRWFLSSPTSSPAGLSC